MYIAVRMYPVTTPRGGARRRRESMSVLLRYVPNVSTQTGEYMHMNIYKGVRMMLFCYLAEAN
jgi:hypothetical protein